MPLTNEERHVVVFPFPFASHPGNLLGFVRRLASVAPAVTFSFCCTEKGERALVLGANTGEEHKTQRRARRSAAGVRVLWEASGGH
ncbi:anthocyanidin 3-O-glucosyltransferase [Sarracenia purpurea var. burkii]